ncbi:right-handed parallel beta-helix repeat-containing protein [Mycolicibacterium mucogenicum]|uniref:Right-handed parallel beta-helix repeat-containing protein n=2 Tax=Mycolicibacterium mucogenicum TaxID=56689 RepID=A0A8E4RD84_MYCMU|nr:right-handed parallel beta-helix repeat-containing protein [Mycolicibacterium mucogenicum]QPG72015.1 right-handed parallel beta-helix repeat-containing protein [Mycolicibacterium mucogenicum DSM 44124]
MRGRTTFAVQAAVVMMVAACNPLSAADGGDVRDDTAALQAQFDALQPGATLTLEPRAYHHRGILTVRTPNVTINGNGATLTATNDETSAVDILGDGITITDVTLAAPSDGKRWMGEQQHKLVVKGQRATVSNVRVQGSAGAGIYFSGATHFVARDITITGTRADGLHMTGGSAFGQVENIKTDQTGDDGVAVVSYDHDPTPCHDITERNITVGSTRWGRGITVVGGNNVDISHFSVAHTSSAGIYVANEGNPFFTRSVERVAISDGTVTAANWDKDIEQGAILVYSGNQGRFVHDVTMSNVTVTATSTTVNRNVAIVDETNGGDRAMHGIYLSNINLTATTVAPFYTNAPVGSYTVANWTNDGKRIDVTSI